MSLLVDRKRLRPIACRSKIAATNLAPERLVCNNSCLVCLTGTRLVDAAFCQFAETYERAGRLNDDVVLRRLFTLHYCIIVAVSATSDTDRLSRYRCLPYGGVWHAQPTLYMDPVRGMTVCEVTAMERGMSCGRSVVGTSRQRSMCCSSHGYRCRLRLY